MHFSQAGDSFSGNFVLLFSVCDSLAKDKIFTFMPDYLIESSFLRAHL